MVPIKRLRNIEFEYNFLRGEWYKFKNLHDEIDIDKLRLDDQCDRQLIHILLKQSRGFLLKHLPDDVAWYQVFIEQSEFEKVKVINEDTWHESFGRDMVKQISDLLRSGMCDDTVHQPVIREIFSHLGTGDFSNSLVIIAPSFDAPATLLEGNHRAVAFQMSNDNLGIQNGMPPSHLIAGISLKMQNCIWYH